MLSYLLFAVNYHHFIDGWAEALRRWITFPNRHVWFVEDPGFEHASLWHIVLPLEWLPLRLQPCFPLPYPSGLPRSHITVDPSFYYTGDGCIIVKPITSESAYSSTMSFKSF
jgi:hypothetical protein